MLNSTGEDRNRERVEKSQEMTEIEALRDRARRNDLHDGMIKTTTQKSETNRH